MYEKILGKGSAELFRLCKGSVQPESLKNTYIMDVKQFIQAITYLELIIIQIFISNEDGTYCIKKKVFLQTELPHESGNYFHEFTDTNKLIELNV
jgi:hypothetical protein